MPYGAEITRNFNCTVFCENVDVYPGLLVCLCGAEIDSEIGRYGSRDGLPPERRWIFRVSVTVNRQFSPFLYVTYVFPKKSGDAPRSVCSVAKIGSCWSRDRSK